ncbi:helix-turn-helix domain-containing protein [Kitasatospora aureofaciens]|uniref:transcriptional regulator n=1 Tax=Kitasatospora aureofaciens TaxID=1894 RepID=UPI0027DFB053|nr:helix-turn-helix domain-containing protein [Kitasatospora aureofaciens]
MPEGIGESRGEDEVARLLQELKSRSGLSYGALAKRLHVSTSALHRYCNGDVMPVEFAPLERLARLCRATPEERTELYRLWVTAHAARGNRQASAPAPAAPEPLTAPEPEVEAVAEPEARPAAGGVAEDGTATPARTSAVPTRRRVRRGVLAAVAAAAVLAAIGAVATGVKTHPGGDPESVPAPAADAGPSAGSPAPGATPVAAGASQSGPAGAADRGASAPITVVVRPFGRDPECDRYVVDRPPSQVPRPPAVVDIPAWVSKVGAVPGHYQSIELTVQGTGSDTVVLTALNVRIARIAAPLAWNAYSVGEGCGGGVGVHSFDLDLDAARPRPVVTEGRTGLPVKVSERDPEVIEVTAETTSHDVSWYLELEWSSGNRKGTLPIGLGDGMPFRTSAVKGRPLYRFPNGGNAWEPSPFQE